MEWNWCNMKILGVKHVQHTDCCPLHRFQSARKHLYYCLNTFIVSFFLCVCLHLEVKTLEKSAYFQQQQQQKNKSSNKLWRSVPFSVFLLNQFVCEVFSNEQIHKNDSLIWLTVLSLKFDCVYWGILLYLEMCPFLIKKPAKYSKIQKINAH